MASHMSSGRLGIPISWMLVSGLKGRQDMRWAQSPKNAHKTRWADQPGRVAIIHSKIRPLISLWAFAISQRRCIFAIIRTVFMSAMKARTQHQQKPRDLRIPRSKLFNLWRHPRSLAAALGSSFQAPPPQKVSSLASSFDHRWRTAYTVQARYVILQGLATRSGDRRPLPNHRWRSNSDTRDVNVVTFRFVTYVTYNVIYGHKCQSYRNKFG